MPNASSIAAPFVVERLTPKIVVQSLAFAAVMGLAGGVLPALRASRLTIVDALRAA